MHTISTKCPCKINLYLDIINKRPDNYHNLQTLMVPISLSDELTITKLPVNTGIQYTDNINLQFDGGHTLNKVLQKISFHFPDIKIDISIHLHKNVPHGAGLGGGSADAAYFLKSLIKLFNLEIDLPTQLSILSSVGADVPFFLAGKPAWCSGIGNITTPLNSFKNSKNLKVLLVYPGISVSTLWAYKQLDGKLLTLHQENAKKRRSDCALDIELDQFELMNCFENIVYPEFPVIQEVKNSILELGALQALMTGSGSCVFGLFQNEHTIDNAKDVISSSFKDSKVWIVDFINT